MDNVKEIKIMFFDKFGLETSQKEAMETRLSIFFDYGIDNHHIQFKSNCSRREVANSLINLSRLITNHSSRHKKSAA